MKIEPGVMQVSPPGNSARIVLQICAGCGARCGGFEMGVATPMHDLDVKVRDLINELEADGWKQVRHVGSHRQFRHESKPGTVTVSGGLGEDIAKGTLGSVVRQAGLARRQR